MDYECFLLLLFVNLCPVEEVLAYPKDITIISHVFFMRFYYITLHKQFYNVLLKINTYILYMEGANVHFPLMDM